MNLSKLISIIGDENVGIQNLDQCSTGLNYNTKSGTKITFGTEQPIDMNGTVKLGMVIWLDREAVKAASAEDRRAPTQDRG